MFLILFKFIFIITIVTNSLGLQNSKVVNISSDVKSISADKSAIRDDKAGHGKDLVTVQVYYESLCPSCRKFDSNTLKQTVLELGSHLDIHLYPYGKARTVDNGDGKYEFFCQHGPAECYGNKLHACSIDILQNITLAALYNSCLMDYSQAGNGSDDAAADVCGTSMSIDFKSIKECAKDSKGSELLKMYGEESKKAGFKFVPHILINGEQSTSDQFKEDVCKAFKNPPSQCQN